MSPTIGSVYGDPQYPGSRRAKTTIWRSTVRCIVLLLVLGILAALLAAEAQQTAKGYRIGVLSVWVPTESRQWPLGDAEFLEELRQLGYV